MVEKYLVFDISASYGHFKKPYTTTSPLHIQSRPGPLFQE